METAIGVTIAVIILTIISFKSAKNDEKKIAGAEEMAKQGNPTMAINQLTQVFGKILFIDPKKKCTPKVQSQVLGRQGQEIISIMDGIYRENGVSFNIDEYNNLVKEYKAFCLNRKFMRINGDLTGEGKEALPNLEEKLVSFYKSLPRV